MATLMDAGVIFATCIGHTSDQYMTDRLRELVGSSGVSDSNFSEVSSEEFGTVKIIDFVIDTKYYSAKTQICVGSASLLSNAKFLNRVEALLLFFDVESPTGFTMLKQVERAMRKLHVELDIRLLICECLKQKRGELTSWASQHDFELVELTFDKDVDSAKEQSESDSEEEPEYFKEKFGIDRVLEALQCHRWSIATYKEPQRSTVGTNGNRSRQAQSCDAASVVDTSASATCPNSSDATEAKDQEQPPINEAKSPAKTSSNQIDDSLDEHEADEFESLFEKFGEMKRVAASLKGDERLEYAERMTTMFWKALGTEGSSSALDSDSDSN